VINKLKRYFFHRLAIAKYLNFFHGKKYLNLYNICWLLNWSKIVPTYERAKFLCDYNKIKVNLKKTKSNVVVNKFDIITFNVRRGLFWYKLKRYKLRSKKRGSYKCFKGMIYNRKMSTYILYTKKFIFSGWNSKLFNYYYGRMLIL